MEDPEEQIAEFLMPFRVEIRSFAQALRAYLQEETKPAFELVGDSAQSFTIGYGFTTTAWAGIHPMARTAALLRRRIRGVTRV